ncbi:unnamed protein product [Musa acuminata subsp. malaccensis]|uniref:(wild Malaysian banana) hypothetical protein n=1 Tax=Musa acuminata subsp. malaccensis TaxID=214687 RepID=A0A804IF08_MUSAM|nr:unnamed protein product [Musa acuminata subsp. malaccensis]
MHQLNQMTQRTYRGYDKLKCDLEHPPGCKIHRSGTLSTLEVSLFSSNVHFFSFINPAAVTVYVFPC